MNLAKNPYQHLLPGLQAIDSHTAPICCHGISIPPGVLDRCRCRQRTDRPQSSQEQQRHPAGISTPASGQGKKGLIGFGKPGWQRELEIAIRKWWFEKTLPAKLDEAETEWHKTQPPATPPPVVMEHPIDETKQTGESRLLGGPISIHAPWRRD